MNRVNELECLLREASDAYYNSDQAIMSDTDFDNLRDELENLDPNNTFLQEVGAPISSTNKIRHIIPMGSLKKINDSDRFQTWRNSITKIINSSSISLSLKLDGISIELVYKNGIFAQAITRGNGYIGEDVTHTIKKATGFPTTIPVKSASIRCECILPIESWKKHFSQTANPRNAASGLVRRLDGCGAEHLWCIAFDILSNELTFQTELDKIIWLNKNKFKTVVVHEMGIKEPVSKIESFINKTIEERLSVPVEIDGVVLKLNDIEDQKRLGEHEGIPYWARAWKFPPMGAHTIIENVEWTVGTQGTITPIVQVIPVSVGGVTINNVTLHNIAEVERLGVRIGDTVEIIRAGDVIPKIIRVVSRGQTRKTIDIKVCPACNLSIVRDGPRLICSNNSSCQGVAISRIKKWIKKRGIMFLGDIAIEKIVNAGLIGGIPDLYSLTVGRMIEAGLGQRMSQKIIEQLEISRNISLSDLIGSISIDLLGRTETSNLTEHGIKNLDDWKTLTVPRLVGFPGYQSTKAERIIVGLQKNWILVETLYNILNINCFKEGSSMSKLCGKSFCFTGTMQKSRKELEELVISNGGEIKSVSKNLEYLVMADPNSSSSKAVKARGLNIKLISEEDFLRMT